MSVDVLNETETAIDELELVACVRYVMTRMRVHQDADVCVRLVDEAAMEVLHVQWMDLPGPTDVMDVQRPRTPRRRRQRRSGAGIGPS